MTGGGVPRDRPINWLIVVGYIGYVLVDGVVEGKADAVLAALRSTGSARVRARPLRSQVHCGRRHHVPSPIAGVSVMPASTSTTWRALIARPCRESLPPMFIRQPRSPASTSSGPRS